jgi:hypothetical protein
MAKSIQSRATSMTTAKQTKTKLRAASKRPAQAMTSKKVPTRQFDKTTVQPTNKIALITGLLRRPKGASTADLMKATGWQAHSVRGAISGSIKKKLGLEVISEKTGTVRLYRIADKSVG